MKKLLTTKEAAEYLTLSASHMWKLTQEGSGPHFYEVGAKSRSRARYKTEDLDKWLESRKYGSTAETLEDIQERVKVRQTAKDNLSKASA